MDKNQTINKIAQDLCEVGGNCLKCNAANSFECTAKKTAKKVYDLYFAPKIPNPELKAERI